MERTPDKFGKLLTYVVIAICVMAMCIGLLSCNPAKRAANKVYKAVKIDRNSAGNACYEVFPTKDSVVIKTEYKQGETIRDTFTEIQVEVINDTVIVNKVKTIVVNKTDTVFRYKDVVRESTVKIDYLRDVNNKNVLLADRLKQGRNNWRTVALVALGILVLIGLWKVVKLYTKAI
jgi:hypothetical protein